MNYERHCQPTIGFYRDTVTRGLENFHHRIPLVPEQLTDFWSTLEKSINEGNLNILVTEEIRLATANV